MASHMLSGLEFGDWFGVCETGSGSNFKFSPLCTDSVMSTILQTRRNLAPSKQGSRQRNKAAAQGAIPMMPAHPAPIAPAPGPGNYGASSQNFYAALSQVAFLQQVSVVVDF